MVHVRSRESGQPRSVRPRHRGPRPAWVVAWSRGDAGVRRGTRACGGTPGSGKIRSNITSYRTGDRIMSRVGRTGLVRQYGDGAGRRGGAGRPRSSGTIYQTLT